MRFDAVMFDLDGTLADTLGDIAAAGNFAMKQLGRPTHADAAYRPMVGDGALKLVERALGPAHAHLAEVGVQHFRAYYTAHGLDFIKPYPGIAQMLDELVKRGLTMAVLSNKPHDAAQLVVRERFGQWKFHAVQGQEDGLPLKPDPTTALRIVQRLNIPAPRWLYLGDSGVDMRTARAAGLFAVGATWGFRDEPELRETGAHAIIRQPSELLGLL